ncbi:molybdate ABC transporter substrate-binding protein [Vibrio aestuarianus]|uniref:molybdate ABC transporter substrate-binding protein n=1 Tax=Vibrio aestuarianus TaxID=28171 RepID=UPI0015585269|nr:molybdate ABC transporter substrate-binding protein [Vibrio aestuarianus]NGZ13899.1 molybdate ABC transporter substrate-binding protein [Vibrio aestuarianus]NKZ50047.1 molybdate ABC transporter substrate-binding protein [Vibrio aestuarianus]
MRKIIALATVLFCCANALAQEKITIYAASSMTNAVNELVESYQMRSDSELVTVYAGSAALARQIEQGAPADVFISANDKWVTHLIKKDVIERRNVSLLAGNQLVLIASNTSPLSALAVNDANAWLSELEGSRLAVGNVIAVPAGMYAKEALTGLNVWSALSSRLAQTNNVRLVLALVERQEADLGIVYKTDALMSNKVKVIHQFTPQLHSAIHYPLVKITNKEGVDMLVQYLQSDEAKQILQKHGFRVAIGNEQFAL